MRSRPPAPWAPAPPTHGYPSCPKDAAPPPKNNAFPRALLRKNETRNRLLPALRGRVWRRLAPRASAGGAISADSLRLPWRHPIDLALIAGAAASAPKSLEEIGRCSCRVAYLSGGVDLQEESPLRDFSLLRACPRFVPRSPHLSRPFFWRCGFRRRCLAAVACFLPLSRKLLAVFAAL